MIRPLNKGDLDLVKEILPPSKLEFFENTYLTNLKTWFAFGYFRDGVIKGISTSYFNSSDPPEWYLLEQYADRAEDMESMVDEVCAYYEQKEIYRFFWLDADFYIDFMKNFIPERYLHFKDYSVDTFMFARNPKHHELLYLHKTFPVPTHIYMSVLSNEYRKD